MKYFGSAGELLAEVGGLDGADGTNFYTSEDTPLQVGYLKHPRGHRVPMHHHPSGAPEALIVVSGRVRVTMRCADEAQSAVLGPGGWVVLAAGGHSLEVLEACEVLEVRRGPYMEGDKCLLT